MNMTVQMRIAALNRLSYFRCMKNVMTRVALIDAIATATPGSVAEVNRGHSYREQREEHQRREDADVELHRGHVRVDIESIVAVLAVSRFLWSCAMGLAFSRSGRGAGRGRSRSGRRGASRAP